MNEFTEGEKHSILWAKWREFIKKRLEDARLQLEQPQGLDETNRIRGRIVELKALLKLDEADPIIID